MASSFKKTEVIVELLSDTDIMLMVEKGIRGEICQAIHWYAKGSNKYMKDYDKKKSHDILNSRIKITYMVAQCRKSIQ